MFEAEKLVVVTFADGTILKSSFSQEVMMNPKPKIANSILCLIRIYF